MAAKFIAFAALVAVARASGVVTPAVAVGRTVVSEPYDPNPQYSYGYEVQDPLTGDSHGQVESRSGDVVQGSYALLDSDGTRRQVDYTADPINGFNAVVSKQPVAVAAPVARVAAPLAAVAPAPILRSAPIAAPILRSAPLAAPILRSAPLATASYAAPLATASYAAPLAPASYATPLAAASYAAPLATASYGAPLLRSAPLAAPLLRSAPLLSGAPLLRSAPLAPLAPALRAAPLW